MIYQEKNCLSALDWQAWLLYNLVTDNGENRNGCFFEKGNSDMDNYRAMWDVVKCELRDRGRKSKSKNRYKSPREAHEDI
jgi:hypothetical protein